MGIAILDAVGPNAETLAMEAGLVTEITVTFDRDQRAASFESESLQGKELEAVIVDALGGLDPEWRSHLRVRE